MMFLIGKKLDLKKSSSLLTTTSRHTFWLNQNSEVRWKKKPEKAVLRSKIRPLLSGANLLRGVQSEGPIDDNLIWGNCDL